MKKPQIPNLKPPSRLCSGLDQFDITEVHFDQQKHALPAGLLKPCHHASQQATVPSEADGLSLRLNLSGLAVNYSQSQEW